MRSGINSAALCGVGGTPGGVDATPSFTFGGVSGLPQHEARPRTVILHVAAATDLTAYRWFSGMSAERRLVEAPELARMQRAQLAAQKVDRLEADPEMFAHRALVEARGGAG